MSKIIVDVSFESEVLDLIRWREVGGDWKRMKMKEELSSIFSLNRILFRFLRFNS